MLTNIEIKTRNFCGIFMFDTEQYIMESKGQVFNNKLYIANISY